MTRILRLAAYRAVAIKAFEIHPSIDSNALGSLTGVNPTEVRRDLSTLGKLGRPAVGYPLPQLIAALENVLKDHWDTVLEDAREQRALLDLIIRTGGVK